MRVFLVICILKEVKATRRDEMSLKRGEKKAGNGILEKPYVKGGGNSQKY